MKSARTQPLSQDVRRSLNASFRPASAAAAAPRRVAPSSSAPLPPPPPPPPPSHPSKSKSPPAASAAPDAASSPQALLIENQLLGQLLEAALAAKDASERRCKEIERRDLRHRGELDDARRAAQRALVDASAAEEVVRDERLKMAAALRNERALMSRTVQAAERRRQHARHAVLFLRKKLLHFSSGHAHPADLDEIEALDADATFDSDARPARPATLVARDEAALAALDAHELRVQLVRARIAAERADAELAQLRDEKVQLVHHATAAAEQYSALFDEVGAVRAELLAARAEIEQLKLERRLDDAQQSLVAAQRAQDLYDTRVPMPNNLAASAHLAAALHGSLSASQLQSDASFPLFTPAAAHSSSSVQSPTKASSGGGIVTSPRGGSGGTNEVQRVAIRLLQRELDEERSSGAAARQSLGDACASEERARRVAGEATRCAQEVRAQLAAETARAREYQQRLALAERRCGFLEHIWSADPELAELAAQTRQHQHDDTAEAAAATNAASLKAEPLRAGK